MHFYKKLCLFKKGGKMLFTKGEEKCLGQDLEIAMRDGDLKIDKEMKKISTGTY